MQRNLGIAIFLGAGTVLAQSSQVTTPDSPDSLKPPAGQLLLFHLQGKGNQIYTCQNANGTYAWVFKAPDAKLYGQSGEPAGHHFAGPTWQANDGSKVKAKMSASVPSPNKGSVPWLLLSATSHEGTGIMAGVETIQRVETSGGAKPDQACDAAHEKQEVPVPYEAAYYFYGAPK